jgi:predicted glycogen debranching enzyme
MPMIRFDEDVCGNLESALSREWLETNGLGGFASSTIIGLNTRRYHGLLVAATKPPVGRMVLLSKLEETLIVGDESFALSANRYPGVVHPQGFRYLKQFRLNPFPTFTYEVNGIEIEKTVFMVHGENSTVVQYELKTRHVTGPVALELRPLIAFRDYHSTTHENGALNPAVDAQPGWATITPYQGLPTLYLAHTPAELQAQGSWYRNFEYDVERERGLDFQEDLFNPCMLRFDLAARSKVSVIASTEPRDVSRVNEYRQKEFTRRHAVTESAPLGDDLARALTLAAGQYIVSRGDQKTVIAGYHWFSDWGRDTMISLPGLTLPTGRFDIARSILRTFAQHVDQGMLPNRFPDAGEQPEYNTVDATLWFFEAVRAYAAYSGDLDFVRGEIYPVLAEIISWHVKGTRYGIKVDPSGLLNSGAAGVQLTWMDAKVGDWVVTPRRGKPVEIQALWFNALRIMEEFARQFGDESGQKRYRTMSSLAQWGFNRLFWNDSAGCLYDVVNGGPPDPSIRPNQVFAVSLPHSMLSEDRARLVVEKVREHLLTPYGLRSLAPSDPQYRGRYSGDPVSRDSAYHQGTVWPWLMGPFISAYVKVNKGSEAARRQAEEWLGPLQQHLSEAGLGQISEVFDGDPPHHPGGCMAQAWSVGEILRCLVEDIRGVRPGSATAMAVSTV